MSDLAIRVRRVRNGFIVEGDGAERYADAGTQTTSVARTPQELACLVETWAKENANPASKTEQP